MTKIQQDMRWRKLDNTGKLFPVIANEHLSNVFRISVTLKKPVIPEYLQQSLEDVLPQFDAFQVKLKRGFFWYYFEANKRIPYIEKESAHSCKYIDPKSNQLFLFRVTYYQCRINLEVFHALTDGMGATEFLKAITISYLQKTLGKPVAYIKNETVDPIQMDVEDSYLKNYKKTKRKRYSSKPALKVSGEYLALDTENIVHGYLDLPVLKSVCKKRGVTITQYLVAVLIWAIYQVYIQGKPMNEDIGINIPINLRSFFDSKTMANFFAVSIIRYQSDEASFDQILDTVCTQMKANITKEKLEETISYNVSQEKKWYLRIVPLAIKWAALNIVFRRNDRAYTTTLSNLGPIKLDEEYQQHIDSFELIIGVSKRQPIKCGVCAYRDMLVLSFTSVFKDVNIQKAFYQWIEEEGVTTRLVSNGVEETGITKGAYPPVSYELKLWKNLLNIFYVVLLAVSACLGAVHYTMYKNHMWLLIVAASISYVVLTMRYSIMRHANLGSKMVVQTMGASVLLFVIDWATKYSGWSVNYGIPSLILFADIGIVFLILVNRLNWQSYFMYQIAITIFSFVPLILWAFGLITRPILAIVTVIISVMILALTIMLGDRSVKHELIRRFHL